MADEQVIFTQDSNTVTAFKHSTDSCTPDSDQ